MNRTFLVIWLVVLCLLAGACHSSRRYVGRAKNKNNIEAVSVKESSDCYRNEKRSVEGHEITLAVRKWLGTNYKYGGKSQSGTDCSGLVMSVYQETLGIKLPRNSSKQQEFCREINVQDLAEGDLVFFTSSKGGDRVNHVGIYVGKGRFIHASTSRGVISSSLNEPYYASHFYSAGRVPGMPKPKAK